MMIIRIGPPGAVPKSSHVATASSWIVSDFTPASAMFLAGVSEGGQKERRPGVNGEDNSCGWNGGRGAAVGEVCCNEGVRAGCSVTSTP